MKMPFLSRFSLATAAVVLFHLTACGGGANQPAPEVAPPAAKQEAQQAPSDDDRINAFIKMVKVANVEAKDDDIRAGFKSMVGARPADFNEKVIRFIYNYDIVFQGLVNATIDANTNMGKKCFSSTIRIPLALAPKEGQTRNDFTWEKPLFQLADTGGSDAGLQPPGSLEAPGEVQVNPMANCNGQMLGFAGVAYAAKARLIEAAGTLGYTMTNIEFPNAKTYATAAYKEFNDGKLAARRTEKDSSEETITYNLALAYYGVTVTYNNTPITWFKFTGIMKSENALRPIEKDASEDKSGLGTNRPDLEKRVEDFGSLAQRGDLAWVEFKSVEDNLPFFTPKIMERPIANDRMIIGIDKNSAAKSKVLMNFDRSNSDVDAAPAAPAAAPAQPVDGGGH